MPALQALVASRHPVVGVLTQPDRPKGRGKQLAASPVKQAALAAGLPVAQPPTLKTEEGRLPLEQWKPDVLVVVAYGLLLPPIVLELPRLGCINIHASLLPRWRGAAPIQRAILAGDSQTGITIMQMDAGLDTGAMLLTRTTGIEQGESAGSLHDRLSEIGANMIVEVLDRLEGGTIDPAPQPEAGVTYAAKLDKREARIDWAAPADQVERQVRAFNPWPIAETLLDGEQLRILSAKADMAGTNTSNEYRPGAVVGVTDEGVVIQCGTGRLTLVQVQRPGKRPVSARDFANATRLDGRCLGN